MDGVKQQTQARHIKSLEKRHLYEVKKMKRQMRAELDRLREQTNAAVSKIKSGYDRQVLSEQSDLEKKLSTIRQKNAVLIKEENERYQKMLEESKLAHDEQLIELENSQQKEIERKQETHEAYFNNLDAKFEAEKNKTA